MCCTSVPTCRLLEQRRKTKLEYASNLPLSESFEILPPAILDARPCRSADLDLDCVELAGMAH